ncbi:MAG: hypothetical protein LBS22_02640 [Puniceicoccales bacterium]|jgi:hypothetical protein|nr:hypothetical protein [Puniceicoccales bacterium]
MTAVTQTDASGAIETTGGNSGIKSADSKVVKFISIMCGGKVNARQLRVRSVTLTDPQRSARPSAPAEPAEPSAAPAAPAAAPAPDVGSAVPAEPSAAAPAPDAESAAAGSDGSTSLDDLAKAIQDGKSKVGLGEKFLTWIKSHFGGEAYDTAIAKKAFGNIGDPTTKKTLLGLAFEAATSPENSPSVPTDPSPNGQDNVKTLLEFCNVVKAGKIEIMEAVITIPNPDDRINVLDKLERLDVSFAWNPPQLDKSSEWHTLRATVDNQLAQDLIKAGDKGIDRLAQLLTAFKLNPTNMPKFPDTVANRLAEKLGNSMVSAWLLADGKLHPSNMPKISNDFVFPFFSVVVQAEQSKRDRGEGEGEGIPCLVQLLVDGKLDPAAIPYFPYHMQPEYADMENQLAQKLFAIEPQGIKCLARLLADGKLYPADLSKFEGANATKLAQELFAIEPKGIKCLVQLFVDGKLDPASLSNLDNNKFTKLTEGLFQAGDKGIERLGQLFNLNKSNLPTLKISDVDDRAGKVIKNLALGGPAGKACLKILFANDSLPRGQLIQSVTVATEVVLALSQGDDDTYLFQCLALYNSLPKFEGNDAVGLIEKLAQAGASGDYFLKLSNLNMLDLNSLKTLDAVSTTSFVLNLARAGENGANCFLKLLDLGMLNSASLKNLDAVSTTSFVLNLARAGANGETCFLKLLDLGMLNVDSLKTLDAGPTVQFVKNMVGVKPKGPTCLRQLIKFLPTLDGNTAIELALVLSEGGEDEAGCLHELLKADKLQNLNLDKSKLQNLMKNFENFKNKSRLGLNGSACLQLLQQKYPSGS